ncbi:MAG: hypothetical protein A3B31_00625 [Candidatus Komeilibacteria bacterium RIFCSPLOWO2_01_FULL_53_11]|uniref:Uncharacterized protein n=1 Tax=Candidatus Komeilibacteria bacterium RIFCSPLOWO2_01_FULL_53_11 TaxID=1798552 RepID=A0A1G2BRY2_9BACT|nr:MAG: hypothetical protein A3B31_00625 [Candidatus Komeilibacteria bacterium RIFCSPLOWO2_01_FULL_53_11]
MKHSFVYLLFGVALLIFMPLLFLSYGGGALPMRQQGPGGTIEVPDKPVPAPVVYGDAACASDTECLLVDKTVFEGVSCCRSCNAQPIDYSSDAYVATSQQVLDTLSAERGDVCKGVMCPQCIGAMPIVNDNFIARCLQGTCAKVELTAAMIAVRKEVSKGRGSVINARFGSVTDAEWPDSCLGIDTGELCAQVITPGYEIEVFYLDTPYTYRTNQDGTVVLLAN